MDFPIPPLKGIIYKREKTILTPKYRKKSAGDNGENCEGEINRRSNGGNGRNASRTDGIMNLACSHIFLSGHF